MIETMSIDADIARKLISIANRLRERGIRVGTMEIETAIRLYKSAILLSGYNYYPLSKIIEAVFVKRDYEKTILDETLSSNQKSIYDIDQKDIVNSGRKEKKRKASDIKKPKASLTSTRKYVDMLKRYLETENPGYLDMLREELVFKEDREQKMYRVGGNVSMERLLARFALNPKDYSALTRIALLEGGEVAVLAMKHLSARKRRRIAEQIASTLTKSNKRTTIKVRGGRWEKSYQRGKIDLRRTLVLKSRGKLAELVYKKRRKSLSVVLIIDRSDSMRKYAEKIVEIASAYLNVATHLILFSDEVKVIPITSWKSKLYLLNEVLDLSFHGYTNISSALRYAKRICKPGSSIVLISDLQQTIRDSSPLKILEDLSKSGYKILVFTTKGTDSLVRRVIRGDVKIRSFE